MHQAALPSVHRIDPLRPPMCCGSPDPFEAIARLPSAGPHHPLGIAWNRSP